MLSALAQSFSLPTDPAVYAFTAAILATGYIYLKARRKTRKDPLAGPSPFSSLSAQRRIENQMTELLVELEKMTRQMNAQLDTRAAKLEELIRQADERLAALDERTGRGPRAAGGGPGVVGLSDPGFAPAGMADPGVADVGELPPPPIPIDPRHAMVYRLADEGRNLHEIAREVQQPAGEVELILKLRRRARS